jgi:ParB family chromosome partitioning protein
MNDEVKLIPIDRIRILNPRHREKKKFEQILQSIKNLGLKKPIQVSLRSPEEGAEPGYDLVCGQGRMEAFIALGHKEIPAIVVEVSKEDRLLRSLVENMARRLPSPLALMNEIERLKAQGYTNVQIGEKLDIPDTAIGGYIALKKAGEERLLDAAVSGRIPLGVARDIAKAESPEMQRELLKAYETKQLNQVSIRTVKRLMDQRRFIGKQRDTDMRGRILNYLCSGRCHERFISMGQAHHLAEDYDAERLRGLRCRLMQRGSTRPLGKMKCNLE